MQNYSPHAIDYLVAWQTVEGCGNYNHMCMLRPDRSKYKYPSLERGARAFSAQIDINHPSRPRAWRFHYPGIVAALKSSHAVSSPEAMVKATWGELRRWCGPPVPCGDHPHISYQEKILSVLARR